MAVVKNSATKTTLYQLLSSFYSSTWNLLWSWINLNKIRCGRQTKITNERNSEVIEESTSSQRRMDIEKQDLSCDCICIFIVLWLLYYAVKEWVTKTLRKTVLKNAVRFITKILMKIIIISNIKIFLKVKSRVRDCIIPILFYSGRSKKIQIQNYDV